VDDDWQLRGSRMVSVTPVIARFRDGSASAFADLFALFYVRQVRQAEAALAGSLSLSEGEDIALDAFHCLWREGTTGKFPGSLDNTQSLLAILHLLTTQQARRAKRYDRQGKRDVRKTVALSDDLKCVEVFDAFGQNPARLIELLPPAITPRQRSILLLYADGKSTTDIATQLRCGKRTIDRELAAIRATLREQRNADQG
jgi:DNA-directed RNA polymerase specialized sigma24 family protein